MSLYGKLIVAFNVIAAVGGTLAAASHGDVALAVCVFALAVGGAWDQFTIASLQQPTEAKTHEPI